MGEIEYRVEALDVDSICECLRGHGDEIKAVFSDAQECAANRQVGLQAKAVMEFVNMQIGAFEAGFVDGNEVSLFSLYRTAQNFVKDKYGIETKSLAEVWGDDVAAGCRTENSGEN